MQDRTTDLQFTRLRSKQVAVMQDFPLEETTRKRHRSNSSMQPVEFDIKKLCSCCKRRGHYRRDCWKAQKKCRACGSGDHMLTSCPKYLPERSTMAFVAVATVGVSEILPRSQKPHANITCSHCRKKGHLRRDCWKKNGKCLRCGSAHHVISNCLKLEASRGPEFHSKDSPAEVKDSLVGSEE